MDEAHTRLNLVAMLAARPTGDEVIDVAVALQRCAVG
jgi:hypothetical protein